MKLTIKNYFILFISSGVIFIDMLDSSILNTALPTLSVIFHTTPLDLKSMLIIYLLGLAITIPLSNYLSLRYGTKIVLIGAMVIMLLSSLGCGLSQSLSSLVFFRLLQGIGAGLSLPIARLIILQNFKKKDYFHQMNNIIMLVTCGTLFGPLLGGIIIEYSIWQWLFWLNIPFGLLVIFFCYFYLPHDSKTFKHAFDWKGFILLSISLICLVLGLSFASQTQFSLQNLIILFFLSGCSFMGYFIHNTKTQNPLINLNVFKYPSFCLGFFGGILSRACLGGIPFILPLLLQVFLKKAPVMAGFAITPIALGVILSKLFSKKLISLWPLKKILLINTLFMGIFFAGFSQINYYHLNFLYFLIFTAFGVFQSFQYASANSIAYSKIPQVLYHTATSLMSLQQQLSISLGIAFSAILLMIFSENNNFELATFQNTFLSLSILSLLILGLIKKFD